MYTNTTVTVWTGMVRKFDKGVLKVLQPIERFAILTDAYPNKLHVPRNIGIKTAFGPNIGLNIKLD